MPTANAAITTIPLTMSSREIADLTGKRHDNVVRDIEKMLNDVGMGLLNFEDTYTNPQNGQEYRCYKLPKNLTINLIAGYRADMRLKIIDRWLELEAQQAPTIKAPANMVEALTLALEQQKALEAKDQEIAALAPKAEALEELASLDGQHSLRDAAKQCGWTERAFVQKLQELHWVYPAPVTGRKCAYADKVKAGLMDVKNVPIVRSGGQTEGVGQPMITQKGIARLRVILGVQPGKVRPFTEKREAAPA